jgi:hypothetical protein
MAVTIGKSEPRLKVYYHTPHSLAQKQRPLIKRGNPKAQGAKKQRLSMKKERPQNTRGTKTKTCDEKRGNPKTQGDKKQRPPMKKEAIPKCKGLKNNDLQQKKRQPQNVRGSKTKTSNEKRGNPTQGTRKQRTLMKNEATSKCKGLEN